ncbi:hypothetical protein ACJIZ3_022598 [Penstemon smallii]|uniref:HMA domain-containing protein n=1 Tax=Penstemon smallii TaxID=265156 RepID=A0ABD3TLP5_9LAMI
MAGKKKTKKETKQIVEAEFNVSMHCNACERSVAKAISKIKGVDKFMTDMKNHKVVVIGKINPENVLKKLKKKTGKKVELLVREQNSKDGDKEALEYSNKQVLDSWLVDSYDDCEIHLMFNDENANACSIM